MGYQQKALKTPKKPLFAKCNLDLDLVKEENVITVPEHFDESIDAVRFLAFLFVFIAHISDTILQRSIAAPSSLWSSLVQTASAFGRQGVTIFFTLTGFLLARVLIREASIRGDISKEILYPKDS